MTTLDIIGSGNIGATVARIAVGAGVEVVIANSRGPESLADILAELGRLARAGTIEEAASAPDGCSWQSHSGDTKSCPQVRSRARSCLMR